VRLDTGADLLALRELDPKLWVALSAPTGNIEFPAATLSCLDLDHDGHIRIPELLAAIDWCAARLGNVDLLFGGASALPLAAIDQNSAAGQKVLASARRILGNLGSPDADAISAEALADPARIFGQTAFNGDGIITALSSDDPTLQAAIATIGEVFGRRPDRSGEDGVDGDAIGAFFSLAGQQIDWLQNRPAGLGDSAEQACAMAEQTGRLGAKIDDYFNRCRLSAYDPRAVSFVNSSDAELDAIGRGPLALPPATLAALPLARIEPGRPLPLGAGVNPAWASELLAWRGQVLGPLLGATPAQLDEAGWELVKARVAPLLAWYAARPAWPVGMPEPDTLRTWLANDVEKRLRALIDADLALADDAAGVDEVRQLVLYVRDLARFANNFVNFREFYTRRDKAVFQCGTLYLDGRSCELVVAVDDPAKHAALASLAKLYLVYCECRRGERKRTIAAALTDGDSDQLLVGRNGVFVDRNGEDWDATIVRLVEHPISLRQAFWAPWRRISRMLGEQLHKLAASKDQAVDKKAGSGIADVLAKPPSDPKAPPAPFDVAKFAGIFAAIGLAIGAIGTVAASLIGGFIALRWWQMPLALVGLLLVVSGPAMVMAWFKLRNRTLGPLLDANGWAINARAEINLRFGQSLTQLARLPAGAERALADPYAEKRQPWGIYLVLLVLLGVALYFLIDLASKQA
ncbi:MAG TPA: hypothetical protein VFH22_13305, partial [Rhodocyclaceae bacterium]|nr:hypothetical protein [Rhodocyclaceae bacterium]